MSRKTFETICKNIDWSELDQQRKALAIQVKSTEGRKSKHLKNLLKFVEKLRDAATDEYGVSMEQVHTILTKVRLINKSKKNTN